MRELINKRFASPDSQSEKNLVTCWPNERTRQRVWQKKLYGDLIDNARLVIRHFQFSFHRYVLRWRGRRSLLTGGANYFRFWSSNELNVGASMSHACRAEMNSTIHMREINGVRQRYQQSITRLKSYRRYFFSAFFFVELWVRSGGGVEVEKRDVFCVRWVKKLKTRWIFFQPEDILVKVLLVSNESKMNNTE